jgi:hypothetical protein
MMHCKNKCHPDSNGIAISQIQKLKKPMEA